MGSVRGSTCKALRRKATRRARGQQVTVHRRCALLAVLATGIALIVPRATLPLSVVGELLGYGILTCPAFYFLFGLASTLVVRPDCTEGLGLNHDEISS